VGSQVGPDEVQLECKGEDAIGMDDATTQEKKAIKKRGMLGWFKLRVSGCTALEGFKSLPIAACLIVFLT
jgi:hypothetical protein